MLRILDLVFSLIGLIILSPFFLILAIWIKIDSNGSVFYIQKRVGKNNIDFDLYKFRSMSLNADKQGLLTVGGKDSRITNSGYFIRKYKLDELPQLFNVLIGNMSLVGPRPEVRKYVNYYTPKQLKILNIRPGITDLASIEYKNENEILGKSIDPEKTYIEEIMPHKLELNLVFIENPGVIKYFSIIFKTIFS
jgi:lipopolysaccharide/colanic/teichoic acid biosynthesis glycosyltransferase